MRAGERSDHPIELLSASIDRELRPAEAAALEAHLEGCAECRGLLVDFRNLDEAIASEPTPPVPVGLEERILEAVRSPEIVRPRPLWKSVMPAAAAASLVMAMVLWFARPDRLPPLTEPLAPAATGAPAAPSSAVGASAPRTTPGTGASSGLVDSSGPVAASRVPAAALSISPPPSMVRPAPPLPPSPLPVPPPPPDAAPSGPTSRAEKEEAAPGMRAARLEAAEAAKEPAPEAKVDQAKDGWTVESAGGSVPAAEAEKERQAAAEADQMEDLQRARADARRIASAPAPQLIAGQSAVAGAAPGMKTVLLPLPRPVGVFARPYVVTLESESVMQVHRGTYNCSVPIEASDGQVVTAAVNEVLGPDEAAARARNSAAAATIVTATPQARESILRLVRETYRPVLESRCGPLPN